MLIRFHCVCLLLLVLAEPLRADSRLLFPRVLFQQGRWSGIAIANPTSGPATITLKAYTADGAPFEGAGVTNPATRTLAAGEQSVELAKQIFTPPASVGESAVPTRLWMEVTSKTDGLTGFFVDGDDGLSFMDGSEIGMPGIALILPIVENVAPASTEIALVNPGDSAAEVALEFVTAGGAPASASQTRTIPARGALLGPLSTLFPISYTGVAALRITSNRPVIGYGYIYRSPGSALITVPAQSSAVAAKALYFPQLAEGDSWATTVGVLNTTNADETVTITAYKSDGTLFAAPGLTNPVTRVLVKRGVLRESARRLFGFPAAPLQLGWIKVETARPALQGYVEYSAGTNRALVPAQLDAQEKSLFSYQALRPPFFTGLAVLNPSSLTTNLEVVSLGPDGKPLGKAQRVLKPGERQSLLIQEWVRSAAGAPGGAVYIKADNPVIATQVFGTSDLTALANVPPQKVTTSYDPAAQLPSVKVSPPLAVVETGKSQKFTSSGASGLNWYVDDAAGGNTVLGTVAADGTYRAPSKVPGKHSIALSARNAAGDLSGGASLNVVQREELVSGLATVTAVAYFENLERFFIAEQQVVSAPQSPGRVEASTDSRILEQKRDGTRAVFASFAGDSLGKILPYVDSKKQNWILAAGATSGKIFRINLDTRQTTTIAQGLNQPNSMVLDDSGDLLVAVENGIEVIPRARFDAAQGSIGSLGKQALAAASARKAIDVSSPRGIAVESCSGAVYVTTANGTLWEYLGKNRRDVLNGDRLADPSEIFVLYLKGETKCKEASALLICEKEGLAIVFPSLSLGFEFVGNENFPRDLEFLPSQNKFSTGGEPALVIAETNKVSVVRVGGLYSEDDPVSDEDSEYGDVEFPYFDGEGDTFETLSPSHGYAVPDIVAVDALDLAKSVLIGIQFSGKVVPPAAGVRNGVDAIIDLDVDADYSTGVGSVVNEWSLFGETFLGVDWYIHFLKGAIIDVATRTERRIDIVYLNDIIVLEVPKSIVDLSFAQLAIILGNWEEITDIAPNALYLDIGLVDPSYSPETTRSLSPGVSKWGVRRLPAPPRRPRSR